MGTAEGSSVPTTPAPRSPGDGLTVALDPGADVVGWSPVHAILTVAYREEDVVGREPWKIRTKGYVRVVGEALLGDLDLRGSTWVGWTPNRSTRDTCGSRESPPRGQVRLRGFVQCRPVQSRSDGRPVPARRSCPVPTYRGESVPYVDLPGIGAVPTGRSVLTPRGESVPPTYRGGAPPRTSIFPLANMATPVWTESTRAPAGSAQCRKQIAWV